MFKLLIAFLCFIVANLEKYISENAAANDELLKHFFEIYTLINRLDRAISNFAELLKNWQNDFYHGSAWSGVNFQVYKMVYIMSLLGDDLNCLIRIINTDFNSETEKRLCYQFRGNPGLSQQDAFSVWLMVLQRNYRGNFCGWISTYSETKGSFLRTFNNEKKFFGDVERRIIFIPAYSLLLPQVKRTSDLENLSESKWKNTIGVLAFKPLMQAKTQWKGEYYQDILNLLPEFPPSLPIETKEYNQLGENSYALKIEVPEQEETMREIITSIQQHSLEFKELVSKLKNTVKTVFNTKIDLIF